MKNSAKYRRSGSSYRFSSSACGYALGKPRRRLAPLAHLCRMNDTMRPFPGLEPVLTTSELAAHLGVPVQTIHDLRHAGRGPHGFRIGRELRYRLSEIQDWITELERSDEPARRDGGSPR